MSVTQKKTRIVPLFEADFTARFGCHFFLSKQNNELFETIILCNGNIIVNHRVDDDFGLTGTDANSNEKRAQITSRVEQILKDKNINVSLWWPVSRQFLISDLVVHSTAVGLLKKSDIPPTTVQSMQSVMSLGYWLEKVIQDSQPGKYGSATELLMWYLQNVPLEPPYFASFKKIVKSILDSDLSSARVINLEQSDLESPILEILALIAVRIDRDLHTRVTQSRWKDLSINQLFRKQAIDSAPMEKRLFLDPNFTQQSKPHLYLDRNDESRTCLALPTLMNLDSQSISRKTQLFLQKKVVRTLHKLITAHNGVLDKFEQHYRDEAKLISHKNPKVRAAIERDSLVIQTIFSQISNPLYHSGEDKVTDHRYCTLNYIADRYVNNFLKSREPDFCHICLAYAINNLTGDGRTLALEFLKDNPRFTGGKFNFSGQDIEILLTGDLNTLGLMANFRLKNFSASAKLYDYFENREIDKMSDLEIAVYAIHKLVEPKHYFNKVSRLFTTKPKFQHRTKLMKFRDSHKQQKQLVLDRLNYLHDSKLYELIRQLLLRDTVVVELVKVEEFWAATRLLENKELGRIFVQGDILEILLPLLIEGNLSDSEVLNLLRLIDVQVGFYSLKDSSKAIQVLRVLENLNKKSPEEIGLAMVNKFMVRLFKSQEILLSEEFGAVLAKNKAYVDVLYELTDSGEFNVLRQLDLLDLAIHHNFDNAQILKLFNNSIPDDSMWQFRNSWSERILGGLGEKIVAIPEVRREILRRIEENPGLLSQNAFGALFHQTTSADARSGVELQNNLLEKYLQILFKVYGEYGGGFGTDSLYRRGYRYLLPIDILNSFANTPVTLTLIVKKLIRECVPDSPWMYYYLTSETLISILVQVNKEIDEAHSGVITELLNDFYSVRGSVSELVRNNIYLELKLPLQNSIVSLTLLEEMFEQAIGTFIELDSEQLDAAIDIFSPVIKQFAFKTTQRLLVHNDVRVQNYMLQILTQESLVESWWMFLAESGSPTLMQFVYSHVIDIKSDELFRQKLLDLFDSSVRATRDLAFKILSDTQDRVNLNEMVQKLAEHPAPDVWSFVLRYYSDLQQKHSKSSLVQNVLLSRRVARHIKSDLMNLIEDDPERQIASPYLSRLSLSKTQVDNEFALKFMAQNPEYFDNVVVEEVWRES